MKIFKRIFTISWILLALSGNACYSQDTIKTYVAFDVFKAFINEFSITLGHGFGEHHLVTFSVGYVYDNDKLREQFIGLSPSQDEFPVMVYNGPAIRSGYEYRMSPYFYAGVDIYYKYLYYNDHEFVDQDGRDHAVAYTRSEKSNFLGGHINLGFLIVPHHGPVVLNPSIAMGGTLKFRNYTTTDVYGSDMYIGDWPDEGTYSVKQQAFSIMINFNIGVRIGK